MISYIYDNNSKIKFIKTTKEIIIDPVETSEATVIVNQERMTLYQVILKYYKFLLEEYKKNEKIINEQELNFYSDNAIRDFANIFQIKNNEKNIYLKTISKHDKLLGDFILITSKSNYGQYGDYFEILSKMLDEIDNIEKQYTKVKKIEKNNNIVISIFF